MRSERIREMSEGELRQTLDELHQEQFNLRFQMAARQLENTSRMREVRRDIARVKTILRERELEAEE